MEEINSLLFNTNNNIKSNIINTIDSISNQIIFKKLP